MCIRVRELEYIRSLGAVASADLARDLRVVRNAGSIVMKRFVVACEGSLPGVLTMVVNNRNACARNEGRR